MALKVRWLVVLASTALTLLLRGRRPAPGRFTRRIYVTRVGARFYRLYLPACYRGQSLPLLVMLHGCKQTPEEFAAGTRMNRLADEYGFIAVYPAQAWRANIERCWNWFRSGDQRREHGEPALIAGITRQVIARYRADPRRVYIAGLSAGGSMAAIMAATYPDLYAAAGVHSGLPYAAARGAATAAAAMRFKRLGAAPALPSIPMIVFHGDSDTTVHPSNSEYAMRPSISEQGIAGGRRYTRSAFYEGVPFEHWLVHSGGHAWSGGSGEASFTDAKGPDASREMLRFFFSAQRADARLAQKAAA
ncbi:MAG TPA: PHB depolymerase family esterase [Burkholderiales bacterium]|nr:PHB depolymerase family esterase [Burkholderiales bacterium]